MRITGLSRLAVTLLCLLLVALSAVAQTSRGAVTGVVTDPSGAVVANATVTLTQIETNTPRTTKTNNAGIYRFDAVALGTYKVVIAASGFGNAEAANIAVNANQTASVDVALKVGGHEQSVTVEAEAGTAALQTEEQLRGGNIGSTQLANLPVPGQNSLNLITLLPGVVPTNLGGSLDAGIGSVNGSRPRSNSFMIDGVENNDVSVQGPAVTLTNNDAIQEVSVQTSNYSAEFGRAGGAVVNQITKTGTNSLHGTLAWVYRSDYLNAANFDDVLFQSPKSPFVENLPAFTIGGPVVIPHVYDGHNKTFFFAAGQWDRFSSSAGATKTVTVPTAAGIATLQALASKCPNAALYLKSIGNLVAPTPSSTINIALDPTVFAATGSCDGTARTGMGIEIGSALRTAPTVYKGDTQQARLDHNFSENHSLSLRYMWAPFNYIGPVTLFMSPEFDTSFGSSSYTGGISDNYTINNHFTNEARVNYFRVSYDFPIIGTVGKTLPTINIASITPLGTSGSYPQGRTFNNYQLQDTMTALIGRHTLRYGVDVNKQIARQIAPSATPARGALNYANSGGGSTGVAPVSGFANFLDDFSGAGSGVASKSFGTLTYHPVNFRQSYFIQDAWKARPNLTLNAGIRYDFFGQPANENFPFPVVSLDAASYPNKKRANVDKNNFGPTVGFAYTPRFGFFSGDKTVIRGGFQIGFDTFYNNLLSNMAAGAPNNPLNLAYNATISSTPGACTNYPTTQCKGPRGVAGLYNTILPTLSAAQFTNPAADNANQFVGDIANPYTMRYSLGVQHELAKGLLLDVSYVGSLGRKLFYSAELNPRIPDASGVASARLNPTIGSRTVRSSGATSNYNALQLDVRSSAHRTFIGGLSFDSNYTWSKAMDTVSEAFATSGQGSSFASSRWLALKPHGLLLDYGVSDFDRRHRWQNSFVLDLKGPAHGILYQILGGWSFTGSFSLQSGTPFSVLNGFDRDGDGSSAADRPDIGNPHAPITSRGVIASIWSAQASALCGASGLFNPDTNSCTTADQVHWVMATGAPGATAAKRNSALSPGYVNLNSNILKKFRITESVSFEVRAEIFNLANHYNYNFPPNGVDAFGPRLDQPAGAFLPWKTQSDFFQSPGTRRTIRLGGKLSF